MRRVNPLNIQKSESADKSPPNNFQLGASKILELSPSDLKEVNLLKWQI